MESTDPVVDAKWIYSVGDAELKESSWDAWKKAKNSEETDKAEHSEDSIEGPVTPTSDGSKTLSLNECYAKFKEMTVSERESEQIKTPKTPVSAASKSQAIDLARRSIDQARNNKNARSTQRASILASLDSEGATLLDC
jgi:hypothetical protein